MRSKSALQVIVEAGGLGYRIAIPVSGYNQLPILGAPCFLHLSQVIREDAHTLYGFLQESERELFERLLTVSGIGPKTALAIIGHIEIGAFRRAVASADLRLLSKIPGIGKKTAERLILELKDRFAKEVTFQDLPIEASLAQDALRAMIHLGYNPSEAERAVQKALKEKGEETDLGRLITFALQKL